MIDDDLESDDELAERLGQLIARVDPVPSHVLAGARASRTWVTFDAELAELMYDSILDEDELVGVRGNGGRLLTFISAETTVELEVLPAGRGIVGQVGGPTVPHLEIRHAAGSVPVEVDPVGRFSARHVPAGPISLRLTSGESGAVTQTEWVVI
jgi:hypothetical protein